MDSKPTIVFIPGAWHSPDSFQLARDALQARGWETEAVAFPTVGAEPPTKGVPDDAAEVRKVLEALAEQGKQIVLVVHSYGGVVGAQAVRGLGYKQRQKEGKAGGIITFLYLSAFVVPTGQSLLKMLGGNWLPWMRVEGERVFADTPEEVFYHDMSADAQKKAVDALTHECIRAFTDETDYEPWQDMHCLYFICEEDKAIPAAVQEQMAGILGPNSIVFRSKASHSPFLSAVQDVVDGVEKAAASGQKDVSA
ncbi:uncharacterized protein FIESC28_01484 [Fusarium coffeatum]|uniref:AB hydrolase-1 domain-containing protein n=1 Tax=Fusarium coffeatum TaxID=231269 RepID=A0A366S8S0_9HYPO|nr:uncharacterized protein FIESC28_01484 [Fusarium coffeatum]RBR25731.1 hypothetical protein FIESC28_01484 [Fusarium coffeatum]